MLIYPVTDVGSESPSYTDFADGYMLTRESMRWFTAHYLSKPADGADWRVSPLRAPSLTGLPPALAITAGFDPLRDEGGGERAERVRAGITVTTHAREIERLLIFEDLSDIVLVGTSSGGMVICKAAELARERIARLAFVDALALLPGERVADIVNRPAANEITALTTAPTRPDAEGRMFADLEPAPRAWALARYTPHPIAALEAPMEPTDFWERAWTASVIRCKRARNPPEAHQRRTALRLKAAYAEMDTGHYPMLSEPEELARLLL